MSSGTASGQHRMGAFYLRLLVLSLVAASTFGHQDNSGTHVSISQRQARQREGIFISPFNLLLRDGRWVPLSLS